jgi:hypothetical protein
LTSHGDDVAAALTPFFDVTFDRIADPSVPRGCLIAQSVITGPSLPPSATVRADALLGLQSMRLRTVLLSAEAPASVADDIALQLAVANHSLAVLRRTALSINRLESVARAAVCAAITRLGGARPV